MCKKMFVLALVLGLAGVACGHPFEDDLIIYYTMDSADSMDANQLNSAVGSASIGSIGDGEETFLAANNGYAPGILGDAVILANDGPLNGGDPCAGYWELVNAEMGNIIDITPEAESFEPNMRPFENKTISLWFMQTAQMDMANHIGRTTHVEEHLFGSYSTYTTYIAIAPGVDDGPDRLAFRAGARKCPDCGDSAECNTMSDWYYANIAMNVWNHCAMVLRNTDGPQYHNMQASFYLNGVLVGSEAGLTRDSDAFFWGVPQLWHLAAIGGLQADPTSAFHTFGIPTGALIDEFAIIDGALNAEGINEIYTSLIGDVNYVTLTVNVEPNDVGIDTVTPDVGQHIYFENMPVFVNVETSINCPDIYHFDHWEGDVADPNSAETTVTMNTDKVITAVFAAGQRECGDECHPILKGDLNEDCYIDFVDFVLYTENWLSCTHPDCD